jgi:hypothetical protein
VVSETKDPVKVRAGTIGARARWADHQPDRVKLSDLSSEQRRLVLALIAAARSESDNAKAASAVDPETALPEVHCHARPAA